ncbi:MAG: PEGA domain-containing protein [Bacteriovorax sp.]|nr:PEGA domain-containing protein [Bacteriovorax sp.]
MKQVLFLIATLVLASCSSTTLITTNDKDAKIYVDGQYVGKGQYTHTDSKMVGSTTMVMLKKEGCEDMPYTFARNEEFDAGACAGGVFLLVPFLWIQKYRAVHNFEFECTKRH